MEKILRRGGRFKLPVDLIESEPEAVMKFMSGLIVVRAEMMFEQKMIEYTALSPQFELLPEGSEYPLYDGTMDEDGNVTWEKFP